MSKDVIPFPVPSPKDSPWDSGKIDDRQFVEKHLGLEYPSDDVLKAGLEYLKGKRQDLEGFYEGEPVELETFSDKPWSDFKESDYSLEEWHRACLIHLHDGEYSKSDCKLPIREPSGTINKGGLRAAWAALNGARGGLDAPASEKQKARSTLIRLMREAGIEVNAEAELSQSPISEEEISLFGRFLNWIRGSGALSERTEDVEVPLNAVFYQLPYDFAEPEKVGKKLWRKHLLPLGKKIAYQGKTLDFSLETLEKMVESFKRRAFDTVYVTVGHGREADRGRGVAKNLFIKAEGDPETDGLYGDFELSEEGEKVIANNLGAIGTSVSYQPDYTREADGEHFGPAIQHVAFTPTPHVPGLRPWEAIAMSDEAQVVDLTEAQYSASERRKESDSVSDVVETPDETREEVNLEERLAQLEAKLEAKEQEAEEERKERERIELAATQSKQMLFAQGVERMLTDRFLHEERKPKSAIDAAKVILAARPEVVELSDDGSASFKADDKFAEALVSLLQAVPSVELGEEGRSDVIVEDTDETDELYKAFLKSIGEEVS